jgi:predicted CoA-binding protein
MGKKTLIIGASTNPERYAYLAANRLKEKGHEIVPLGVKKGEVAGVKIENEKKHFDGIDTVTLYVGPQHQNEYKDYIKSLKPKRVIFNPGTVNPPLMDELEKENIEVLDACTLVLLSNGLF